MRTSTEKIVRTRKRKSSQKTMKHKAATRPGSRKSGLADTIMVVNMIPKSLSFETNQDSEPNIAVNPLNPDEIIGTAFTPDPAGGNLAPIYVSSDGGKSWSLSSVVPSKIPNSDAITGDISVGFSPSTNTLYAGILGFPAPPDDTLLKILRTKNVASGRPMEVLTQRRGVDQPFVLAGVSNFRGGDRVYVGDNDLVPGDKTSTVDLSLDAAKAKARFKSARIDQVGGGGQNGPQVRPACHADGTVYVAFYRWLAQSGNWEANTLVVTADVVIVRDDNGASRANPFSDLQDSSGSVGFRVARSVKFPFHHSGETVPGQQRRGGDIAVAVDPTNSARVYLAWAAVDNSGVYTLHLRRSTDRGQTWSANDLRTIDEAINPGLAINRNSQVGFLYQQLAGKGASQRWVTHFRRSLDQQGANWDDKILANVPATTPPVIGPGGFDPYIGDYVGLVSVNSEFFGVFCANNTPDEANFPNGVTFQRSHDFGTRRLLDLRGNPVAPSIDPFFFRAAGT